MALETSNDQIHFVLFPLMAQGHMIPMMDIAKLLAQRGLIVTIVTTHENATRFAKSLDRAVRSGLSIQIVSLSFPSEQVGLPKGCENLDMLPDEGTVGKDVVGSFFDGAALLQEPAEKALEGTSPRPSCIISDTFLPWTVNIANKLRIPRIVFNGSSGFYHACLAKVSDSNIVDTVESDTRCFVVPGLPDHVELTKEQLSLSAPNDEPGAFSRQVGDANEASHGTILNSFEGLEPGYAELYRKSTGRKVWCVGPVSLCNEDETEKAHRGNKVDLDEHACLEWLDSFPRGSVVYACMGSMCVFTPSQWMELGLGLEASGEPFVWVVGARDMEEMERLIEEDGFEKRLRGRGMLIRGWAPQLLILSHPAVGGFLTHCGWNSTLEGICAGLPLITWPFAGDEFANQKLVGQILEIGVGVGASVRLGEDERIGVFVKRRDVERAIRIAMDRGGEGEKRRKKARELKEMAKRALDEGGSSHNNLSMLISDVMNQIRT